MTAQQWPRQAALSAATAAARLGPASPERFVSVFARGTLVVEYYAPQHVDRQRPHARDELYVVTGGHAVLLADGVRTPCVQGDCLFVAAGVPHRFEEFDDAFAVWVFFYGPSGGEVIGTSEPCP